jgi:hypothetical protein
VWVLETATTEVVAGSHCLDHVLVAVPTGSALAAAAVASACAAVVAASVRNPATTATVSVAAASVCAAVALAVSAAATTAVADSLPLLLLLPMPLFPPIGVRDAGGASCSRRGSALSDSCSRGAGAACCGWRRRRANASRPRRGPAAAGVKPPPRRMARRRRGSGNSLRQVVLIGVRAVGVAGSDLSILCALRRRSTNASWQPLLSQCLLLWRRLLSQRLLPQRRPMEPIDLPGSSRQGGDTRVRPGQGLQDVLHRLAH